MLVAVVVRFRRDSREVDIGKGSLVLVCETKEELGTGKKTSLDRYLRYVADGRVDIYLRYGTGSEERNLSPRGNSGTLRQSFYSPHETQQLFERGCEVARYNGKGPRSCVNKGFRR